MARVMRYKNKCRKERERMKRAFASLMAVLTVAALASACAGPEEAAPVGMPEDFQFSLVWNTYGESCFDSETGKLVKTTHATHPEDYVTELILDDDARRAAWEAISALDLADYPAEYDPNPGVMTTPSMTLVLTVVQNGTEQEIRCENIAQCYDENSNYASKNKKGQAFMTACHTLIRLITATPEWQALPEYEFFYE